MAATPFFKTERTASAIKAELLPLLFEIWATIMLQQADAAEATLGFMDLQAGLDSGEPVPAALQVLRQVYKSTGSPTDLNKSTNTFFYDADEGALHELKEKAAQLAFCQDLVHQPALLQEESYEVLAAQLLEPEQPTLAFLNPAQEGLAQQVLLSAAQVGQPDVLLLFNPKGLEGAVKKAKADDALYKVFGENLVKLKAFYKQCRNTDKREEFLVDSLETIFQDRGLLTLRFRINYTDKKQTSHYVVLAIKSARAYTKLKELLQRYSDLQEDGVPLLGANLQVQQLSLFQEHFKYSVIRLAQELLDCASRYSNRSLQYIYEQHNLGTPYTLANYQTAYEQLMRQGKVRFINPRTGQPVTKITPTSLVRYTK